MTESTLMETGQTIALIVSQGTALVQQLELTTEKLNDFENYVNKQSATLPIFDPTYYRDQGRVEIERCHRRIHLLRILLLLVNSDDNGSVTPLL